METLFSLKCVCNARPACVTLELGVPDAVQVRGWIHFAWHAGNVRLPVNFLGYDLECFIRSAERLHRDLAGTASLENSACDVLVHLSLIDRGLGLLRLDARLEQATALGLPVPAGVPFYDTSQFVFTGGIFDQSQLLEFIEGVREFVRFTRILVHSPWENAFGSSERA